MPRWLASRMACKVLLASGAMCGVVLAVQVDAAQALGDRPAVERAPGVHQRLPEQLDHAGLVAGLDHDQRRVRADQRDQVLQFAHDRVRVHGQRAR